MKTTKVALVLDKSGSMGIVKHDAINGFNQAIEEIQRESDSGGETLVSLITFNHQIDLKYKNLPVEEITLLSDRSYAPSGSTALRDAVGEAIAVIGPLNSKEDAALVIVVTDGYENASRNWTQNDLAEKIQELEDTGQWTFTFMCANLDPKVVENEFNVAAGNVSQFACNAVGVNAMAQTMTGAIGTYMVSRAAGETNSREFYKDREEERAS